MMARSHVLAGAAGWLAAAPQVAQATGHPLGPGTLAASTVVCAGAALLPDLDHEHGTLAHALGPVSKTAAEIIADLSGGHRHATHSLVFGAGMGSLAAVALTSRWLLMLTLAGFLAATAIRALELPRVGWPKSYAVAALATAAAARWLPGPWLWLPPAVTAGCWLHMAGDLLTLKGVPLLWPLPWRLEVPLIDIDTSRWRETRLIAPGLAVAVVLLSWTHFA
jgi:membrane-bound metal-dependent hydrolase YbcI (DUF457 family)